MTTIKDRDAGCFSSLSCQPVRFRGSRYAQTIRVFCDKWQIGLRQRLSMVLVQVYARCGGLALTFADAAVPDACSGSWARRLMQQHQSVLRACRAQ